MKCCDGVLSATKLPSVVHCQEKNIVRKYYSTKDGAPPSAELMELLDFEQVEIKSLTKDEAYKVLEYKYIKGEHNPQTVRQVVAIIKKLDKLHRQGLVHGDIWLANVLFCKDSNAYIIDLDLVAKEGSCYPPT